MTDSEEQAKWRSALDQAETAAARVEAARLRVEAVSTRMAQLVDKALEASREGRVAEQHEYQARIDGLGAEYQEAHRDYRDAFEQFRAASAAARGAGPR